MKRDEKIVILAALENAMNRCQALAEKAENFEEQQYQYGQADGFQSASTLIARRPEE